MKTKELPKLTKILEVIDFITIKELVKLIKKLEMIEFIIKKELTEKEKESLTIVQALLLKQIDKLNKSF